MNKDIKQRFVNECIKYSDEDQVNATLNKTKIVFGYTKKYEEIYNKDAALFTFDEIMQMYTDRKYIHTGTYYRDNKVLTDYTEFYLKYTGEKTENVYKYIASEDIKKCRFRDDRYLSYDQVQEIADAVLNYAERAIILLLWDGVQVDDILYLTEDQVDYSQMIINVEGKKYNVSEKTCEVLKLAFPESQKVSYGNVGTIRKVTGVGELYKRPYNARGEDTYDKRKDWLYRMMRVITQALDVPYFSPERIRDSAMLHDLREAVHQTDMPLNKLLLSQTGIKIIKKYSDQEITRSMRQQICEKFNHYI